MIRRGMTGLLTLLLAVSVIGWIVYIPPSVLNPLRAIPFHAQIIYQSDLFSRTALEKLPVPKGYKNAERFFPALEDCPLALAIAPLGGLDRRDTWILIGAPGWRAMLWSWKLRFFPPSGVKALRSYGAWPVWQFSDPEFPLWARVRFSFAEGLLICSVSGDSHDIEYLLDTLDGRRPSAKRGGFR